MGAGGAARTLLNIINNLDRDKFVPILVTLNYNGSYETYIKEDVKFIKLDTKRLRSAIIPLARVIRKEKVDIIFSTIPNYNTIAILARLLSFTKAKNIVREAAYLGGTTKTDFKLRLYGLLYRFASRVIALSNGVKENIIQRYKLDSSEIKVIYNPVDIGQIERNMNKDIPEKHASLFTTGDKTIISAGRLVKDKDQYTLLNAFAKVNQRIPSKLIILGEGPLENELKNLASELSIQNRVHFLGFQTNPYVYFKNADLFVLSSIREGFGHVLAEALAVGVPVVSTNCRPGAIEVLDNGKYGTLCEIGNSDDMANKIIDVLKVNDNKRKEIIEKGRQRANQFHASRIVEEYEATFLEVTQNRVERRIER